MLGHPSAQRRPHQTSAPCSGFTSCSSAKAQGTSFSPELSDDPFQGNPEGSTLLEQGTVAACKVFLSRQEGRQKSHSNFGELKQKAGVKAQQRAWVVFVFASSIYGQTAAVCWRKDCAGLFPPRLELGMLLPQQLPARPCGESGCAQPSAEGSRGQEEGGNGVRRRYEAWA